MLDNYVNLKKVWPKDYQKGLFLERFSTQCLKHVES